MPIYDISMEIHEDMMVYKNRRDKKPVRKTVSEYKETGVNESRMILDLHTGTHIDAPYHMMENGETIDKIDPENFIRIVSVLDMTSVSDCITEADLSSKSISEGSFILLKTKNSMSENYDNNFVFLEKGGAQYLKELNISGVGIDALGIERSQPGHDTHKILMGSGCLIIEGLRLKDINEGRYMMYALPIKIKGGDGAPARVVLVDL